MQGSKNFPRGTMSSRTRNFPATAAYRREHVQPDSLKVDCGINVAVNPELFYIIPILTD